MERDFLAAIGKEHPHPHKEKAAGAAEDSGMLPGLLSPPAALCFLICARTQPWPSFFLPCLVGFAQFVSARCGMGALRNSSAPFSLSLSFSPVFLFFSLLLALLYPGNKRVRCGHGCLACLPNSF